MKILKFGGSSLADAACIRRATKIVRQAVAARPETKVPVIVVASAMGGVTNELLRAAAAAARRETSVALPTDALEAHAGGGSRRSGRKTTRRTASYRGILKALWKRHDQAATELATGDSVSSARVTEDLTRQLGELDSLFDAVYLLRECSPGTLDRILAYGERLSAQIVAATLRAEGTPAKSHDARKLIVTDDSFGRAQVDFEETCDQVRKRIRKCREVPVVTGFTGATRNGQTTTLGRGGSDYTAALLGAAVDAEAIELWTDVDGVLSADPRIVPEAFPLPRLSYTELMELSHFGAKVVYPPTIHPARSRGIPLVIKNTRNPEAAGTRVEEDAPLSAEQRPGGGQTQIIRGISSINQVALMRLEGDGMVGVPGISMRLFGALAREEVSVILISQASSEHSICFAVAPGDADKVRLAVDKEFELEKRYGVIDELVVEEDRSVIAAVGGDLGRRPGVAGKLFSVLGACGVNVRAIAQGSSELNISLVIDRQDEAEALNAIHGAFFAPRRRRVALMLAGVGRVGTALLGQIRAAAAGIAEREQLEIRVVALADSRRMVLDAAGIDLATWRRRLEDGVALDREQFRRFACRSTGERHVLVDCTASTVLGDWYGDLLEAGVAVVAANKLPFAGPLLRFRELYAAAERGGAGFFHEATVGAGLPLLSTLTDLRRSGDRIERIDGVLSGTVNAVLNRLAAGEAFSQAVRGAHADGLTEPHPWDDLSGGDVARKLCILGRLLGKELELADIEVEPVIADRFGSGAGGDWSDMDLETFWNTLAEVDDGYARRLREATAAGCRLRYVASLDPEGARVKLEAVAPEHPAHALAGADNLVAFTTARYHASPLVLRGPGAGPEVTAAGVFADILRAVDREQL